MKNKIKRFINKLPEYWFALLLFIIFSIALSHCH